MKNKFLSCFFLATLLSSQTAFSESFFGSIAENVLSFFRKPSKEDDTPLVPMGENGEDARQGEEYSSSKGRRQCPFLTRSTLLAVGSITTLAVIATAAASIWATSPSSEADQPIDLGQCENFYNQWMKDHAWETISDKLNVLNFFQNLTAQYQNMTEDVKPVLKRIGLSGLQRYIDSIGFQVEVPVFVHNQSVSVDINHHLVMNDSCIAGGPGALSQQLNISRAIAEKISNLYEAFPHQVQGALYELFHNSRDILTEFMPSNLIPSSFKESWDKICGLGEIARAFPNDGQLIRCNFKDSCTDTVTKIVTHCVDGTLMACEKLPR
jgi:hypothetical protein